MDMRGTRECTLWVETNTSGKLEPMVETGTREAS